MIAYSSDLVGYFGFGSLVNRDTLRTNYVDTIPAALKGWRRHWQARTQTLADDIALLSVHVDPGSVIKGLIVIDHAENLAAVDEREAGYTRVQLTLQDLELFDIQARIPERLYVYVADEGSGRDEGRLLQSYLDAVMQGFYRLYGEEGVAHFVDTTANFDRHIIADRHDPQYPRSVILSQHETMIIDQELRRSSAIS